MNASRSKVKGMVSEIGLERDDEHFRSFNLKISVVIKPLKILDYDEAERLMKQFRKDLLGREVELTSTIFRCPTCGREFKNERGLNKHLKTVHKVKRAEKNGETPPEKSRSKKTKERKDSSKA
ncbi:MAG: C2H2-type zinc finger protein [Candidatus Bathyarchaeia archaeon]